jgi:hypothetical protein
LLATKQTLRVMVATSFENEFPFEAPGLMSILFYCHCFVFRIHNEDAKVLAYCLSNTSQGHLVSRNSVEEYLLRKFEGLDVKRMR